MSWTCAACAGTNPEGTRFCGHCGTAGGAERSPELRDERRLVTAVFADVSGFSKLADRLDPERLQEIIDPVVEALSNVVGRYDGLIEKFAGDALMALFGAPVAHGDDAARALHVALEMHRELASLVPRLPPEGAGLALHVGVNSGHGVARLIGSQVRLDYGVVGDVVVLAQRLQAAAPVGETYVGAGTRSLASREFEFESVGSLELKGKAEPVPAWRLVGPRRSFALPAPVALVGRDAELASVAAFVAEREGGGAVFVTGEPGLGKSVLCEGLRTASPERGWAATRCLPYGGAIPYWPFAELLRRLFDLAKPDAEALGAALAAADLADELPFIARLLGIELEMPALTGEGFRKRLHAAVVRAVLRRVADSPLTVLFDDLQWADEPTVLLLRDLLAASAGLQLLVLVTSRPEGGGRVESLSEAAPSLHLDLSPLPAVAVGAIASRILGGPPDARLLEALVAHTGGNPFFIEEVTRSLLERGAVVRVDGRWVSAGPWDQQHVPLTVEGVVAGRIDALRPADRASLGVLAVVGRRADLAIARAVQPDLDGSLPALVKAGLVDPLEPGAATATFHHPLTQQVAYSRLVRRSRADLHRRAGEAAEALYGSGEASVERLARHFYLGEQPAKAYGYVLRAAERAERLFANDQALDYLGQALELVKIREDAEGERQALLLRCAQLEEVRGGYEAAAELYRELLGTGIDAVLGLASTLFKLGEYPEALAVVRQARADVVDPPPDHIARLATQEGRILGATSLPEEAVAVLRRGAEAVAGEGGTAEAEVLIQLARAEELTDEYDLAYEHAERARQLLEAAGDLQRLPAALRVLGGVLHDLEEAGNRPQPGSREILERASAVARRVGNAEEAGAAQINLASVLNDQGLYSEGVGHAREAVAAFESIGLKGGIAAAYANLAESLSGVGLHEESLSAARAALEVGEEIGHNFWITGGLNGMAMAFLNLGDYEQAAAAAERAAEVAEAAGLAGRRRSALRHAAEAHAKLGDASRAHELETLAERIR